MGKHLWNLSHPLPSSNWATWARANLLRGRSIWDIPIPHNSSWTWRKVLQLRPLYRPLIKYIVGHGRNISLWFDNWLPSGPIQASLGDRVIYDSGLSRTATVAEITLGNLWRWPVANSPELLILKEETSNLSFFPSDKQDSIAWVPSTLGIFSTRSAWENIRHSKAIVMWRHIVWFPGNIPRASFILWLAIRCRLGTQDRLHNLAPGSSCLLCHSQVETHDHLFFACSFTSQIWSHILQVGDFSVPSSTWEQLVTWVSLTWRGKSLQAKVRKLCLSTSVYHVWKERNQRFHLQKFTSAMDVSSTVEAEIRLQLSTFRGVLDNPQNRHIQLRWRLPEAIYTSLL